MKWIATGAGLAAATAAMLVWGLSSRENEAQHTPSAQATATSPRTAAASPRTAAASPRTTAASPSLPRDLSVPDGALTAKPSHAGSRRAPAEPDLPAPARREPSDWHRPRTRPFDDQALAELGIEEDEIDRIHRRWEEWMAERAELPPITPDTDDALELLEERSSLESMLEEEVRADLGDGGYDAMRFATNKPNRIILFPTGEDSPTLQAGILDGDELIRYDGERIFSPEQLKPLLKAEPQGEIVPLEMLRGEQLYHTEIPRGRLGSPVFWGSRPPYWD